MSTLCIGQWFITKWTQRFQESSTFMVAQQMRKQGVPLDIALACLRQSKATP